jgi:hypothetical protein
MFETALAECLFLLADQERFARLSGDYNPMHLNPVIARRTLAGDLVVHGMHSLLWSLNTIADRLSPGVLRGLEVSFVQFFHVGEVAKLLVMHSSGKEWRVELRSAQALIAQFSLKFDSASTGTVDHSAETIIRYGASRRDPLTLDEAGMANASGEIAYTSVASDCEVLFPHLAAWIGAEVIPSLLSLTRLVGMVLPGLHSIFHQISIAFLQETALCRRLIFSTRHFDPRFSAIIINIRADGIAGMVKASLRPRPVLQRSVADLKALVLGSSPPFRGQTALVIGGSRGLGEITAKLLGAGGASVIVTYSSGADDACAVVRDIISEGGEAYAVQLNCLLPIEPQFESLPVAPDSIYFFATPRIYGRIERSFSPARFQMFTRFYIEAFSNIVETLTRQYLKPMCFFYPSTVFIEQPTRHMSEYAMAKAAGELLCTNLSHFTRGINILVQRLPRLTTDQTAGIVDPASPSTESVIKDIVFRVQGLVPLSTTDPA